MNKTVLEIRELILSAIDHLKNYFLKKDPIEIQETEKPNLEKKDEVEIQSSTKSYPDNLGDGCPDRCGCKDECESDKLFFSQLYMYYAYKENMLKAKEEKQKKEELDKDKPE